jgi:hypothetical protein
MMWEGGGGLAKLRLPDTVGLRKEFTFVSYCSYGLTQLGALILQIFELLTRTLQEKKQRLKDEIVQYHMAGKLQSLDQDSG